MTAKKWGQMSHDEKVAIVRSGRKRGLTDEQIGDENGGTKGQVVGFRHRHVPELTGKERTVPVVENKPQPPEPDRGPAIEPTRAAAPAPSPARRTKAAAPPSKVTVRAPRGLLADPPNLPKLTTNEALMCTYVHPGDKKQCAYRFEDDVTKRCRYHPR